MDTPCKLKFIHSPTKEYRNEKAVSVFVQVQEEVFSIPEENIAVLTENVDLSLVFSANSPGRLYMDGLDMLPESNVQEDERGEVFLSSSEQEQVLYVNDIQNGYSYYPLIPGFYQIKIEVAEQRYYTLIRVKPKQVYEEQWETMRNEIEDTLHGLAQDLVRKNLNLSNDEKLPIPITYMRQWILLSSQKSRLLNAIEEIQKAPRYQIVKTYEIVPNTLAKRISEETIKFRSQHPEKKDVIKEAKPVISYNLPENRWLIHIVNMLASISNTLYKFLSSYEDVIQREIEELTQWGRRAEGRIRIKEKVWSQVRNMKRDAKQFRSAWNRCLQASWVQEISTVLPHEMPLALSRDSRYRLLYQMYKSLKKNNTSITLNPAYTYNWKRTDYLYEIWGFIQVIKAFLSEDLGYTPSKGWLFDISDLTGDITVPELRKGSFVEFFKDSLRIRVLYEEELPASAEGTRLDKPLYTSSHHNLPDCRIDVFDERGHIGSLLLDFKYRPLSSIWDRQLIKTHRQTKTMKQLDAYSTACRSPWYLKGRADELVLSVVHPVAEVWPVFPYKYEQKRNRVVDEYRIRPMDVTPGRDNSHLHKALLSVIDQMRIRANRLTNQ